MHPASTKQGFVSPLSNYSRSLARSLGNPQLDYDQPDNKQPTPQDARPPAPANAGSHTFRCEAYFDKHKCQYNRCVEQTRGSYLIRDGCDSKLMSFSLGGDPSELLLSLGWRWPWGTSRSVREAIPLGDSRLTWQWRSPWCRPIRRANGSPFTLARPPGSAVHSPLRNSCLIEKVVPKRESNCGEVSTSGLGLILCPS